MSSEQFYLDFSDKNAKNNVSQHEDYLEALLYEQARSKQFLVNQNNAARARLGLLRQDVQDREKEIARRRLANCSSTTTISQDALNKIYQEKRDLMLRIQLITREIDTCGHQDAQKPLYECRPPLPQTRGDSNILAGFAPNRFGGVCRPPGTPPPQHLLNRSNVLDTRTDRWGCEYCTFLNEPSARNCEQCNMPKGSKPTKQRSS
ncbi:unnamed protein product [Dimorphilus gyrociliatus]|uniref:RanBP2-type domain-containing protein n=1 Tax=Dimorphilus gyrociliatus TaxID=2664684 RepID=A0A7I8VLS1_9ANNE|nr:unnamed protein product [Dimorphilus gyrociliatus]